MHKNTHIVLALPVLFAPMIADAHVSIQSGPSFAAESQVVIFGVGHGCEEADGNLDTTSVTVEIPQGITSVRPELSDFGDVSVETDKTGAVVAVTWTKDKGRSNDIAYYELKLRLKTPNSPFTSLLLPAHQTCKSKDGSETVVDWIGEAGDSEVEPAPVLNILPARFPGWNKYTVDEKIKDLETFFSDAQIVWQGDAAYSPNPAVLELISATKGVSSLDSISAGDTIWVKY